MAGRKRDQSKQFATIILSNLINNQFKCLSETLVLHFMRCTNGGSGKYLIFFALKKEPVILLWIIKIGDEEK